MAGTSHIAKPHNDMTQTKLDGLFFLNYILLLTMVDLVIAYTLCTSEVRKKSRNQRYEYLFGIHRVCTPIGVPRLVYQGTKVSIYFYKSP